MKHKKSPMKSKAVWAGAATVAASLTPLILHYTGALDLDATALGASWTTLLTGALSVLFRLTATESLRGLALFLAPTFVVLGGCGPRLVVAERTVDLEVRQGPPCEITVKADGEVVSTVRGPERCAVRVP